MDNVVVVGYGVQNKRDVTTAISSIKAEDFADMPTGRFRDAMAAKMPGVQVLTLGGQPDGTFRSASAASSRPRRATTRSTSSTAFRATPGPFEPRKAATSRASKCSKMPRRRRSTVRAARAASSLITTKRGTGERPVVSYDGQFSVSNVSKTIDMLNAYEFAKIFKEARDGATCSTFRRVRSTTPTRTVPRPTTALIRSSRPIFRTRPAR